MNLGFAQGVYHATNPSMVHFDGQNHRRTFVAYQSDVLQRCGFEDWEPREDGGCNPFIVYYDWDVRQWYGPFQVGVTHIGGDLHSGACIYIDSNDRLHVFFGSHGTAGRQQWTRSKNSVDGTTPFSGVIEDDFEIPRTFGTSVTYPQIVGVINSRLVLLMRGESVNPAYTHSERQSWWESENWLNPWDDVHDPPSFSKVADFIDSGNRAEATVYMLYAPVVDSSGSIHVGWHWLNETTKMRYNTCYARYDTREGRWERADGTPYIDEDGEPVPITLANAEVVSSTMATWAENLDADETGRPYVSNGHELHVWETNQWVQRTPPGHIVLLEVVSSDLLFVYTVEEDDKELCRYQSSDRGASFSNRMVVGQWSAKICGELFGSRTGAALAKASGDLPSVVAFSLYTYTNPPLDGDEGEEWQYEVGQLWAACTGFPD